MRKFEYTVRAENGIHARPAGLLVKEISKFASEVTVSRKGGKSASGKRLFALMQLGVRQGDDIVVSAEGADEDEAMAAVSDFIAKNF